MDPDTVQPELATVPPVGDGDGDDAVGFQQVHGPPGRVLFAGVGARSIMKHGLVAPVDGAVGLPEGVLVTGALARFSTQGHVFCGQTGRG